MAKIIAAINMTIDGVSDHTAGLPDEEIHNHYADLLHGAGAILYGRITYELMQFWQTLLKEPSGDRSMDEFAIAIDKVPKIIFSRSLQGKDPGWDSAEIATRSLEEMVKEFKQSNNDQESNIYIGSRSLIIHLMKLNLIDEYQLCVHPVVAGGGMQLFENLKERKVLSYIKSKTFKGGAVILYYASVRK